MRVLFSQNFRSQLALSKLGSEIMYQAHDKLPPISYQKGQQHIANLELPQAHYCLPPNTHQNSFQTQICQQRFLVRKNVSGDPRNVGR
jgi:hypothetical protein